MNDKLNRGFIVRILTQLSTEFFVLASGNKLASTTMFKEEVIIYKLKKL